jgi:hypothetical protein
LLRFRDGTAWQALALFLKKDQERRVESIAGIVTIVQEGRFQLLDAAGVSHHFILHYGAAADPEQLPNLVNRHVLVSYKDPGGMIGHVATRLLIEEP